MPARAGGLASGRLDGLNDSSVVRAFALEFLKDAGCGLGLLGILIGAGID